MLFSLLLPFLCKNKNPKQTFKTWKSKLLMVIVLIWCFGKLVSFVLQVGCESEPTHAVPERVEGSNGENSGH